MKMQYQVPVERVDEIPEELMARGYSRGTGQWEWLRELLVTEMGPEARDSGKPSVRRFKFPNKSEMQKAQAAAQGVAPSNTKKKAIYTRLKDPAYHVMTRSQALANPGGEYYLYIRVSYESD